MDELATMQRVLLRGWRLREQVSKTLMMDGSAMKPGDRNQKNFVTLEL